MELKELEELRKTLCTDAHKRIEKVEKQISSLITLLISTLVALLLNILKEIFIK